MICDPQAVSEKWPALVEAGATVVLAAVAIFQWLAMRKNNKAMADQAKAMAAQAQQERDRWLREDEIRKEANRPKAEFWFLQNGGYCEFHCLNVGAVTYVIREIRIYPVVFRESEWPQSAISPIPIHEIGFPGGSKNFLEFPKGDIERRLRRQDSGYNFEFALLIADPDGKTDEIRRPFNLLANGKNSGIHQGFAGLVVVQCPACKTQCDSIMVNDLNSSEEIEKRLDTIHQEYRQTCPAHTTTSDKVYVMPPPPSDAPRYDG